MGDFHFYVKCVKPLILALPLSKDRSLASAWVKRLLEDATISEALKLNYLKLLIFFLQRRKLDGPFVKHPEKYKSLSDFPKDQNLFESINPKSRRSESTKPFTSDYSSDLRTYVAYQDLDNLVHCYYATSNDPMTCWGRFDKELFPTGTRTTGPNLESSEADAPKPPPEETKKVVFSPPPVDLSVRMPPSWGTNLLPPKTNE